MFKPEATIRLLRKRLWGAKAMERRVIQCCADNPECLFQEECSSLYGKFVDFTDMPSEKIKSEKRKVSIKSLDNRKQIYHQLRELRVGSVEARANLSATKVKNLEATGGKCG